MGLCTPVVPYELLDTLPYLMTIAALIVYSVVSRRKGHPSMKRRRVK